ncbi:MAG: antitoxin [Verrucomicrobiota bacterium]
MKKVKLDKEEAALEKEIENGEWVLVPDMENEITKIRVQAHNFLNKNKKINLRLSDWDYNKIKIKAVQEGLPYQTLISGLIHKYVTGQLKTV